MNSLLQFVKLYKYIFFCLVFSVYYIGNTKGQSLNYDLYSQFDLKEKEFDFEPSFQTYKSDLEKFNFKGKIKSIQSSFVFNDTVVDLDGKYKQEIYFNIDGNFTKVIRNSEFVNFSHLYYYSNLKKLDSLIIQSPPYFKKDTAGREIRNEICIKHLYKNYTDSIVKQKISYLLSDNKRNKADTTEMFFRFQKGKLKAFGELPKTNSYIVNFHYSKEKHLIKELGKIGGEYTTLYTFDVNNSFLMKKDETIFKRDKQGNLLSCTNKRRGVTFHFKNTLDEYGNVVKQIIEQKDENGKPVASMCIKHLIRYY